MERWPDFFIAGAPKAGTTALHAALVRTPGIALSTPKEPKYFLCDDRPPTRAEHRGPGDAHSRQEWIWRRKDYLRLWDDVPDGVLRGESTPFYLYDRRAHARIAAVAPEAKLIACLRDPVDRAYSNWMHLWSDGLEPESDFLRALAAEPEREAAGWAPFWRYRGLGRYGEQLESLYHHFPRDQVLVLRYRDLVDEPQKTLSRVAEFLELEGEVPPSIPADNSRPFRPDTRRNRAVARGVRAGAHVGSVLPPHLWRRTSAPLLAALHRHGEHRPELTPLQRQIALEPLLPDIDLLEAVTGVSFEDWRSGGGNGSFATRQR